MNKEAPNTDLKLERPNTLRYYSATFPSDDEEAVFDSADNRDNVLSLRNEHRRPFRPKEVTSSDVLGFFRSYLLAQEDSATYNFLTPVSLDQFLTNPIKLRAILEHPNEVLAILTEYEENLADRANQGYKAQCTPLDLYKKIGPALEVNENSKALVDFVIKRMSKELEAIEKARPMQETQTIDQILGSLMAKESEFQTRLKDAEEESRHVIAKPKRIERQTYKSASATLSSQVQARQKKNRTEMAKKKREGK